MESFFGIHHTENAKEVRKVEPFFKVRLFHKMPGKNTTEVFRKHLMAKKVRIRAGQEESASATDMAYRLSRQKLTKEYLAVPSVFMPPPPKKKHWYHQRWG